MDYFKKRTILAGVSLAVLAAIAALNGPLLPPAHAQTPALPPQPYNVELGPVITNSARTPGTVTTAKLQNLAYNGIECTLNQHVVSGSPTTTFSIQMFDSASSTYQTMVTSGTVSNSVDTPTTIAVYPGISATVTNFTGFVGASMHLPLYYRVSQTISGANTTSTGTLGCNLLK